MLDVATPLAQHFYQAESKSLDLTFSAVCAEEELWHEHIFFSLFDDCVSQAGPEPIPRGGDVFLDLALQAHPYVMKDNTQGLTSLLD